MEYEYCLLGYQNKCTTEWGLLSFIHMQSQSNEHPLHNPSRTWPSLKALQQCGLFYPTTALEHPLFSAELSLSGLRRAFASLWHIMCTSSAAITYDYSFAWQRIKRSQKCHCQNSWQICWLISYQPLTSQLWSEPWHHQPPSCFLQHLSWKDCAQTVQLPARCVKMRWWHRLMCWPLWMICHQQHLPVTLSCVKRPRYPDKI